MKKAYIYIVGVLLGFTGVSCNSDDPMDATEKHVYTEGEAPYLRADAGATTALEMDFPVANIEKSQYINLKDYASVCHKTLNRTVDETLSSLINGDVVFYTINGARQRWNLTSPNYGDYGWYYSKNGICNAEDATFTISLDLDKKRVEIKAVGVPAVGTLCDFDFGFAKKNGTDFDDYVRFTSHASVTDPSKVILSAKIPGTSYGAYSINFKNYSESIMLAMGLTVDDFIKKLEKDEIDVYLVDKDGKRVVTADKKRPDYTSGGLGYWLDPNLSITTWSDDGYPKNLMFMEYVGDGTYNLGNANKPTPAGTQVTLTFDFVEIANTDNFLQFIVAVTFN